MKEKVSLQIRENVVLSYDSIADEFDATRNRKWKEFDLYAKYLKEGFKIADIGCGNGRFLAYLKETLKQFSYTGVDNSKNLLLKAKDKHQETFIEGDMLSLPLQNNEFDATVCIAALHHIPSRELRAKAVQELSRITKEGGIIIVSVWNLFSAKYKKYIWKSRIKSIITLGKFDPRDTFIPWKNEEKMRYYYAFKTSELKQLLEKNQLEILEIEVENNIVAICRKK